MKNKTNNISETEINQNGLKGMNQFISDTENIFEMITNNQLLKDAEQGDADAQYILGSRFATGDCVEKNEVKAAKWYRKAAEQGYPEAQLRLGLCYRDGEGVKKNFKYLQDGFARRRNRMILMHKRNLGSVMNSGMVFIQTEKRR